MGTYFRVKASHWGVASRLAALAAMLVGERAGEQGRPQVASRTAALAAVRERPGSRTAVCAEATAQVSRAELSPELIAGFYFAFALAGLLAVTSGKFLMSS